MTDSNESTSAEPPVARFLPNSMVLFAIDRRTTENRVRTTLPRAKLPRPADREG